MSDFEFRSTTSDRAIASNLSRGGLHHTLATDKDITEHRLVGAPIGKLLDAVRTVGENMLAKSADLSRTGFDKAAFEQVERTIAPAFRAVQAAQPRAVDALDRDVADFATPRFAAHSEPATRAEQRTWWRTLPMPTRMQAVQGDPELRAAIVEGGEAMAGVPQDVFERMRREMVTEQLAQRIIASTSMRTEPTADNPIAGEIDIETARTNAADKMERLDAERELLARVPALLSNVVTTVAVLTGENRNAAFARLTAR